MMLFEDLQKLLLYQRLNLGYECDVCKRKFYNRLEHLLHISSCKKEQLQCKQCGKTFGHQKILQLHMQFHNLSASMDQKAIANKTDSTLEVIDISESDKDDGDSNSRSSLTDNRNYDQTGSVTSSYHKQQSYQTGSIAGNSENGLPDFSIENSGHKEQICEQQTESSLFEASSNQENPKQQTSHVIRARRKIVPKKRVGLTKVRMEDCLRCDACSCIYIDPKDYYKHMRNFHQIDVDNSPIPQQKSKKKCRSCCKQCRGVNCTGAVKKPRATQLSSNLIFRINMRDNIKNRWSRMVSHQMTEQSPPEEEQPIEVNIKPDPDAITIKPDPDTIKPDPDLNSIDLSHLLSQVEVKIKVEPPDDFPF